MASILHYLAYGSNLHPRRLGERVPSARPVGRVRLAGYRLHFHKRGQDGSGKCNIEHTRDAGHVVNAVLYRMAAAERVHLDRVEGLGRGYEHHELDVVVGGVAVQAFAYVAHPGAVDETVRPFTWYRDLVVLGARHHRLPKAYTRVLESVVAVSDPDAERHAHHQRLIDAILKDSG